MTQQAQNAGFSRILYCTDFSQHADAAFTKAAGIASANPQASLTLLHVIPEPQAQFWRTYIYEGDEDLDAKARRDIDARIDEVYRPLTPDSIELNVEIRIGCDYREILDCAKQINADLIVIGHKGHTTLHDMFAGNVAEKVVRHAPCAVLVVTAGDS